MESAGDFEPASDGGRLDSRLFGIQGSGALLMGPSEEECRHGGAPSQRGLRGAVVAARAATREGHFVPASPQSERTPTWVNAPAFRGAVLRRGLRAALWGRLQGRQLGAGSRAGT